MEWDLDSSSVFAQDFDPILCFLSISDVPTSPPPVSESDTDVLGLYPNLTHDGAVVGY